MSGRAAALRVARRNAWRNRKRTLFLVALIAVPVAVAVVVAGMFRASNSTVEESVRSNFGDGDILVQVSDHPEVLEWLEAELAAVSPSARWTVVRHVWGDLIEEVDGSERMVDIDPGDPVAGSMVAVVEGRAPQAEGEVALSPRLAEQAGVKPGALVDMAVGDETRSVRIVGLAGSPQVYDEALIIVTPAVTTAAYATAGDEGTTIVVADDSPEVTAAALAASWEEARHRFWPDSAVLPKPPELEVIPDDFYVYFDETEVERLVEIARLQGEDAAREEAFVMIDSTARPAVAVPYLYVDTSAAWLGSQMSPLESAPTVATGVSGLLLLEVAFVAGAAFAAGTRRRLREIGLLGANGASDKHIRLTVLGEGLTVGSLGAVAGTVLGIGVLLAGRPILQRFVSKLLVGVGVQPWDLLGPAVMAVGAAALAAWVPARTASRVPTTTALQGRMPAFPPRRWVVPVGFGLAGLGGLLLVVALASTAELAPAIVIIGGAMAVGGTTLLAGPILAVLSKGAEIVSATPRLVLRDSGRHRTRSAVAVAATLVILLIPVLSLAFQSTAETQGRVDGLSVPEDHLVLTGMAAEPGMVGGAGALVSADISRVAALVPEESVATFQVLDVPGRLGAEIAISEGEFPGIPPEEGRSQVAVAVASPELVEALDGAELAMALEAEGIAVLGVERGRIDVELAGERYEAPELAIPALYHVVPRILISEEFAARLPDADRQTRALFVLSRPMTEAESSAVYSGEFDVIGGWSDFTVADLYPLMLGGTLLVVLIVIALVTAVSAAEVDHDLGIVVAVGAPGSIRRRFLGVLAGYQTLVAALLAIPLGLGLLKAVGIAQDSYYAGPFGVVPTSFVEVPWPALLAVGVVLPLAVAALTALSVRSAPVTPPRRPT